MDIYNEYLELARLALSGAQASVPAQIRRAAHRMKEARPEVGRHLQNLLKHENRSSSFLRRSGSPSIPSAPDQTEVFVTPRGTLPSIQPVWPLEVANSLEELVLESENAARLEDANLKPTRSVLFIGPPGVGKTLAANWLAEKLGKVLKTLDLASVMSSYLGRSGSNLSRVILNETNNQSVLFLDEFDSIAKRRDDPGDVGELKRLVNVLLQSLDSTADKGLLIAATNHPNLLDPAVWRRFDKVIQFPMPDFDLVRRYVSLQSSKHGGILGRDAQLVLSAALVGRSFSDIENWLNSVLRSALVRDRSADEETIRVARGLLQEMRPGVRADAATMLYKSGVPQRQVARLLGVSRDTIRRHSSKCSDGD